MIMHKNTLYRVKRIVVSFLTAFTFFCVFLCRWTFSTWKNLQLDELIFHLKVSVQGTSTDIVKSGILSVGVPTVLCLLAVLACKRCLKCKKPSRIQFFNRIVSVSCAVLLLGTVVVAWDRLNLNLYLFDKTNEDFIQENYIDPAECSIVFPEKKKNLIYIYLESTETTFADYASGGAFEQNVIPELTEIALANENFGGGYLLNGAHVLSGSTWTMGAMFAHTSGLPLKIAIDGNSMNTQEHFFPSLVTLGDILNENGYHQTLLIGSDASFGGRAMYFSEHGNYQLFDYNHAVQTEKIPSNYYVWWGFEDQKLFEYAKEEVLRLAAQPEPFNLTLLTVDTHFEDGYVCQACPSSFEDQYSNVFACSSRQVAAFVEWIQEQDFYEDTVIVLAGDHLTMDSDYCSNVSESYVRKTLVAYINAQKTCKTNQVREYSTFDLFPTTLSALGAEISGDRLGLGVNLFSSSDTLVEQFGATKLNEKLSHSSRLMNELGSIELIGKATTEIFYEPDAQSLQLLVYNVKNIEKKIASIEASIQDEQKSKTLTAVFSQQPDQSYSVTFDLSGFPNDLCYISIYAIDQEGNRYQIDREYGNVKLMGSSDVETYLERFKTLGNHTLLISVSDEASNALSDAAVEQLRSLGLKLDLQNAFRQSYYAVVGPNTCKEQLGSESLGTSGTLEDGCSYRVLSCGWDAGASRSQIIIDQTDYSPNMRGMNLVVYDNASSQVVDASNFDTYLGTERAKILLTPIRSNKYQVQVSDVVTLSIPDHLVVYCWNPQKPSKASETIMKTADGIVYTGETRFDVDKEDVCITIYAVDQEDNRRRLIPQIAFGEENG